MIYASSRDSGCTWQKNIPGKARRRFSRECPRNKEQSRTYDLIEFALRPIANLVMVPIQDYLQLSNEESHMNTPQAAESNPDTDHPNQTK